MRILAVLLGLFLFIGCSKKLSPVEPEIFLANDKYFAQVDSARQARIASLTKPQGWLSVIGLYWLKEGVNTIGATDDNTIVFPRIDTETIGAYQLEGDKVFFGKVEGVEVNSDGHEYLGGPVDVGYPPTVANHQSLYWYVLKRGDKYGIRLKDTLAEQRLNFPGLDYFKTTPDYKVEAIVRKPKVDESVSITNVLGKMIDYKIAAHLDFELYGKEYSLTALDEGGETYFVIFGDLTNAVDSYGGGRFIYPKKAAFGNKTTLDFNLAVNPPCAFTDFATCPLPPASNKLQLKIKAGERVFGEH